MEPNTKYVIIARAVMVIIWVGGSFLVGEVFRAKKRSFIYGFFVSFLISPVLGALIAACSKSPERELDVDLSKDQTKIDELKAKYAQKSDDELRNILTKGGYSDRAMYVAKMLLAERTGHGATK